MASLVAIIPAGGQNPPGITKIYWANVGDIDTFDPINSTTLEIPSVTMISGKTFVELASVREVSEGTDTLTGFIDAQHTVLEFKGHIKGNNPAIMASLNAAIGARAVVLLQRPDGTVNVLGTPALYAEVTEMATNTGKMGTTDRNGTNITIRSIGHVTKMPYLAPGVIDTLI